MTISKKMLIGLALGALVLAGCGSKDDALGVGGKAIDKKALKALNLQGAPNWVINSGQGEMSAVGDAEVIAGNLGYARTEALANARDELARQISTEIAGEIKNVANSSGVGQDARIERATSQITSQSVAQSISGTKQTDTWITNDGSRIFVLIKLDEKNKSALEKNIKQAVQKSELPQNLKQQVIDSVYIN